MSKINWQTGKPKKRGTYLLSLKGGVIKHDGWNPWTKSWYHYNPNYVVAWCALNSIEPFKPIKQ